MSLDLLLESVEEDMSSSRLINGDKVRGIFVSDADVSKKYVVTEHEDFYVVEDDKTYQVGFDDKGLVKKALPYDNRLSESLDFDVKQTVIGLDMISRNIRNKSFLSDKKDIFNEQVITLTKEKEAISVNKELLDEVIKSYVPSSGPVSPFSRYSDGLTLFRLQEDKKENNNIRIWHRPLLKQEADFISSFALFLESKKNKKAYKNLVNPVYDELAKKSKDELFELGNTVLDSYVMGRSFGVENIRSLLKDHGLTNGSKSFEQMYNVKRDKEHWQFFVGDPRTFVDITKSDKEFVYTRQEEKNEDVSFDKTSFPKLSLYDRIKHKSRKFVSHLRKYAAPYIVGAGLLFATSIDNNTMHDSFEILNNTSVQQTESIIQEEKKTKKEEAIIKENEVITPDSEPILKEVKETYIVKPGDCLWSIAKEYCDNKADSAVLAKTNLLAEYNDKLTIDAFISKKENNEDILVKNNPHLIFPGDTLIVNKSVKEEVPLLKDNKKSDDKIHDQSIYTPPSLERFIEKKEKKIYQSQDAVLSDKALVPVVTYNAVLDTPKEDIKPVEYTDILKALVTMKNKGANFDTIKNSFSGFSSDASLKQAFRDYQQFVQSGLIVPDEKLVYDNDLIIDEVKHRIRNEYVSSKDIVQTSKSLSDEYGVLITPDTMKLLSDS